MRSLVILVVLIFTGVTSADERKLRLIVYPRVALSDGVRIEAFVPREKDNRRLRVEMDGPLFRAFEEPLEGEDARALFTITIDRLPEGQYMVAAVVLRADGTTRVVRAPFCRGAGCFEDTP